MRIGEQNMSEKQAMFFSMWLTRERFGLFASAKPSGCR
jgi:hypothetical protein